MKTQSQIRILLNLNIIGSIGLLIWWLLFPVLLPISHASDNFQNLILDPDWTALNLVGLVSSLLLSLGLTGLFLPFNKQFSLTGFIGLLMACAGLIMFTAIQYYETLIWPVAAELHPEMVQAQGILVSGHSLVLSGLIVSGLVLGAGYILFGVAALRTKNYPSMLIWFLMLGAVVFGNGILFPVRTVGLILFTVGTFWISVKLKKTLLNKNNESI